MLGLFGCKKKTSVPHDQFISTSNVAAALDMGRDELFQLLASAGWIERINGNWALCKDGASAGGIMHLEEGQPKGWVKWPPDIMEHELFSAICSQRRANALNATKLGEALQISAGNVNQLLAELGWIKKDVRGWVLTENGAHRGGEQAENKEKGYSYVLWPRSITTSRPLQESVKVCTATMTNIEAIPQTEEIKQPESFRSKFPPEHVTMDGHRVRSRAEIIIDNYLYMNKVLHAYERRLPIEVEAYCDWYLPDGEVYVEYWGMEDNPQYLERKQQKIAIYRSHNLHLIELNDTDIKSLDDTFPGKLLKYNIRIR